MRPMIDVQEFLKQHKIKKGKRRLAVLVDHFFMANSSGIFTFLVHLNTMIEKWGIRLDVISEVGYELPEKWDTSNVSFFFSTDYLEGFEGELILTDHFDETRAKTLKWNLDTYFQKFDPIVILSSSCVSAWVLEKYPNVRGLHYTHHGDIMAPGESEYLGLTEETVRAYIKILINAKHPHASQTGSSVATCEQVLKTKVELLPEPYYQPRQVYRHKGSTSGVLMIGSNYTRKNYEQMLEIVSIAGLPAVIVTGSDSGLKELARRKGVEAIKVIENVPNDWIPYLIGQCRVMLHLSHTEVMPYGVLEAAAKIPVIVNERAPWCSGELPIEVTKVDPEDPFSAALKLQELYGDSFEYLGYDVEQYGAEAEKLWRNFLGA